MNNEIPQEEKSFEIETGKGEESSQPKRSFVETVFLSPEENRLRAGWRLSLQVLLLIVLLLGLQYIINYYLFGNIPSLAAYEFIISQSLMFFAATGSVYAARILIDERSMASLGLRVNKRTWIDLAAGIGIAALMMGLIFLIEWVFGWIKFEGFAWNLENVQTGKIVANTLVALGVFIIVGWQEELFARGYWLQNLEEGLNIYWAVGISSLFFAAFHITNPNFSIASLVGLILSALFLAYGYVSTRRLWFPIGLHIGWNFFEGSVFGFPVSGLQMPSLIIHTAKGPKLWTGGTFGPEAGLILLLALGIGTFFIWAYSQSTLETAEISTKVSTEEVEEATGEVLTEVSTEEVEDINHDES